MLRFQVRIARDSDSECTAPSDSEPQRPSFLILAPRLTQFAEMGAAAHCHWYRPLTVERKKDIIWTVHPHFGIL